MQVALPITPCEKDEDKVRWDRITIDGKECFMKRNTEPIEFQLNPNNHRLISYTNVANALRNEKLAIDYVRENTSVPVPNIVFYLDEGSRVYLATEVVQGIDMYDIEDPEDEEKVREQLDVYVKELETHRSSKIRGFGTDVCFPTLIDNVEAWFGREAFVEVEDEPFVLCHGDLHPGNVIVDPETMKINAIIDREYAGFYPSIIDPRRYKNHDIQIVHLSDGTLMPRMKHVDMARELIRRYRQEYHLEKKEREGVILWKDGKPKYKASTPSIQLPDPNKVLPGFAVDNFDCQKE